MAAKKHSMQPAPPDPFGGVPYTAGASAGNPETLDVGDLTGGPSGPP